jgi:hypothetical protein
MGLQDSFVKTTPEELKSTLERDEQMKADLLEEMGITKHDVDKLRGMMLSSEEAVIAKKEELDHIRSYKGRKEQWDEFVEVKRRMGRVMHHTEIIDRLRTILPNLIVCRGGQQGKISLNIIRNTPISEIDNYPLWNRTMDWVECPVYIGFLDLGYSPEYEIDIVNDVDVAIGQKRGWRTLLLRLHMRRKAHCELCKLNPPAHPALKGPKTSIVTEEQMYKAFGFPTNGATATNYRRQLWQFRHGLL